MICYKLDKQLNIDKLINDIRKLISNIPQEQSQNTLLTLSLQKIVDYDGDPLIPKIEYNQGDCFT